MMFVVFVNIKNNKNGLFMLFDRGGYMKKKILSSIIISLTINTILFIINLICAHAFNMLPLSKSIAGGECIEHIGFGVSLLEIFVMSVSPTSATTSYEISLDLVSFVIPLIVVFLVALLIKVIIGKYRK